MLTGRLSGHTQVAGVIGWPVEHSRSPAIHNAAYRELGVDMVYLAFPVRPNHGAEAAAGVRALGIRGLSVTMPHKEAVIGSLDSLTDTAAALGAVNCITNDDGDLVGDNTDGSGFLAALRHEVGIDVADRRVLVVGAGGAARAIVHACALAGAASIGVLNRTTDRARLAAGLAGSAGYVATADDLPEAELVVNATSLGMAGTAGADQSPIDVDTLAADAVVVDIVYEPEQTPLLRKARARNLTTAGGLPMLAGQAAVQIERWVGQAPPLVVLLEAARRPL